MGSAIPMLDLMFFLTENQDNPRHVGGILIFQRPPRGGTRVVSELIEAYRSATPVPPFNRVPRFRAAGLPEWEDVSEFDMQWHVQECVLPAPGTDAQLHQLVAELHAPMLERNRPGWRVFVIDGLERDRFAVYVKIHHSLVDGESGIELVHRSLARRAGDRRIRPVVEIALPSSPTTEQSADPLQRIEHEAIGLAHRATSIGWGAARLLEEALSGARGYSPREIRPFTAPHTPMNEPIHNARIIAHTMLPLQGMKSVARRWGATLNDVALCVLDDAMNRYLRELGKAPDRPIMTVCPVSLHDKLVKRATTLVSIFWAPLGKPAARLAQRMQQVMANTRAAKDRVRSMPRDTAYAYSVLSFVVGETLNIFKQGASDYLLPANVLISNVRGPRRPLYLRGCRLEALCPVSTLISGMGLNITLMSYDQQVVIGFTANASALPGAERMAQFTRDAFHALARQPVSRAVAPSAGRAAPSGTTHRSRMTRRTRAVPQSSRAARRTPAA